MANDEPSKAVGEATEVLDGLRLSVDDKRPSPPISPQSNVSNSDNRVASLQKELDRTREEKDALAAQYQSLLTKVTAMRTTLGDKLRQDAEELDRREQMINEQAETINTMTAELVASNDEAERVSRELDVLRGRALEDNAYEASVRSRDAAELERTRLERDEWERAAQQERVAAEEYKAQIDALSRSLEIETAEREELIQLLQAEKQTSANLQSVLEDFQAVKELELRQAVSDHETQFRQTTKLLAEFKHRAYMAEEELSSSSSNAQQTANLEKELKEKNLLIGKLRHETVIINEHLTEALRRLRKNSSSSNSSVDRRLITNILLQFLTASRSDPKRFEMLSLLSSILSWDDHEKEKAGIQRSGLGAGASVTRRVVSGSGGPKSAELDRSDETESFSKMWVEFLLKESAASPPPTSVSTPAVGSTSPPAPLSPTDGKAPRTLRASSIGVSGTPTPPPRASSDRERASP